MDKIISTDDNINKLVLQKILDNNKIVKLSFGGMKEYSIPITDSTMYLKYSKPIIDIDTDNKIIANYKNIKIGDTINIWNTYYKGKIYHLVCQIITSHKNYTFGFYYGENKKNQLNLNTPDNYFNSMIIRQKQNPTESNIKLISRSLVNQNHIDIITNFFDKRKVVIPNFVLCNINKEQINDDKIQKFNKLLDIINIKSSKEYDSLKNRSGNDICVISQYNIINIEENDYCYYSGKKTKKQNCYSKLLQLFDDILTCGGPISNLIVIPSLCSQKGNIPVPKCKKIKKSASTKKTTLKKENINSSKKSQRFISLSPQSKIEEPQKGWFGRMVNKLRPKKTVKRTIKVSPTKINIKENLPWYKRIFKKTKKNNL